jgi:hypothetical protein
MLERGERVAVGSSLSSCLRGPLFGGVFFGFGLSPFTPAGLIGLSFWPCSTQGAVGASFQLIVPYWMSSGLVAGKEVQVVPCMHSEQSTRYMFSGKSP